MVAAESLAGWEHPELGTLAPALFIPLAEKLGLMGELTRLTLRLSLRQQRAWAAAGWSIPVSVNAAPESVTDPGFPAVIAECLRSEDVPGHMLVLEVSEQTGTAALDATFFAQLAELGVRSLWTTSARASPPWKALGGWPVNELKLDISIVAGSQRLNIPAIIRNTIDLAHRLGVKVVGEGVSRRPSGQSCRPSVRHRPRLFLGRPMPPTGSRIGYVGGDMCRDNGGRQRLTTRRRQGGRTVTDSAAIW